MKSRLALVAVLALGTVMSGGGAAMGVSALSSDTTAGEAQYGPAPPQPCIGPDGKPIPGTNAGDNCAPTPPQPCIGPDGKPIPGTNAGDNCAPAPPQPCIGPDGKPIPGTNAGEGCAGVLGARDDGGQMPPADGNGTVAGTSDTSPETSQDAPEPQPAPQAQAPRQAQAAGDDELPFTGYAAIPLLLGGVALLGGGAALRRSTMRGDG